MRRRRVGTADRNGDPLDGIVNLFDVAIVLAVGFLVAALAAAGVSGLLTRENMTIVTDPGSPDMQVIVKEGDSIRKIDMDSGAEVAGVGTLIGSFYRLADGTVVYVPEGAATPGGYTPPTEEAPTPVITPPTETPQSPYAPVAPSPTPTVTLTPDAGGQGDVIDRLH